MAQQMAVSTILTSSTVMRTMNVQKPHQPGDIRYPGEEHLSRLLIDGVEDYAIFLLNPYGDILTWNTGAARLMGYTRDEAIGRHFCMFYPPDDRAAGKPQELLAAASEQGRAAHEGWHQRKDGTRFWAEASLTAVVGSDGSVTLARMLVMLTIVPSPRRRIPGIAACIANCGPYRFTSKR